MLQASNLLILSNNSIVAKSIPMESIFIAHYFLFLVIIGTLLNSLTFITLCRSKFRNRAAKPTFHYMRAIAIFDILMLYGWNLDHYLSNVHGFTLQNLSIPTCRLFSFLNYFAAQSSAWLRVFISLDRYLALSRMHQTWFSHSKNGLIVIATIIAVLLLLNFHFFLFACFYETNGTVNVRSLFFPLYPLWDYVNLGVYNCAPFILMILFNSGVIYHLFQLRHTTTIRNLRIQHRSISITLLIITFLFLIMTAPATIAFAFFTTTYTNLLLLFDGILYSYHIISCPLYFITYSDFRRECIAMMICKRNQRKVLPLRQLPPA